MEHSLLHQRRKDRGKHKGTEQDGLESYERAIRLEKGEPDEQRRCSSQHDLGPHIRWFTPILLKHTMGYMPQLIDKWHGVFRVLGGIAIIAGNWSLLLVDPVKLALDIFCLLALIPN